MFLKFYHFSLFSDLELGDDAAGGGSGSQQVRKNIPLKLKPSPKGKVVSKPKRGRPRKVVDEQPDYGEIFMDGKDFSKKYSLVIFILL